MLLFEMSIHIVGAILSWRETIICLDNSPDWPRFRYEPQRDHSPQNEGEDHRGYNTAHEYNRDGHRNSYLTDHYARDE